jgi:hypothetical protein
MRIIAVMRGRRQRVPNWVRKERGILEISTRYPQITQITQILKGILRAFFKSIKDSGLEGSAAPSPALSPDGEHIRGREQNSDRVDLRGEGV